MNNQEKLISLLQPKDYISKIKLYCKYCETKSLIAEKVKSREKEIKQQKRVEIKELQNVQKIKSKAISNTQTKRDA